MLHQPPLVTPSDAEIGLWEQRVRAVAGKRMSLPVFKGGYCYVTSDVEGLPALLRLPVGQSLDKAEVVIDPRSFAQPGECLTIQSWSFFTDDTIAFCLADETEFGVLRFFDLKRRELVGQEIRNFRWGALARSESDDALFYTVHRPTPLTPGPVEWRVRIGASDNARDVIIPAPDQPAAPELVQWPAFSVHENKGRRWLVVVSGPQAGELTDVYLADLSAPGTSPERPHFESSLRTTLRGSLAVHDGTASFVSTDMGRLPRGAVFQAPIGSLTDRASWRQLVPMPDAPGVHLNSVRRFGTGRRTRLLVHRTQGGADALDVRSAKGRLLYSIDGPPHGRTAALYGVASGAPANKAGRFTRLLRRLHLARTPPPSVLLSWGDVVASTVYEYSLRRRRATARQWPLAQEAAPPPIETVTRVWRASYADGKTATARLILAKGTDPSRSIGTVVEQYSLLATPQAPAVGAGSPQPYAAAWLRHGGGVLTVMIQDPVFPLIEEEAASGVASVLTAGATAGLVRPRTTILTGTSAAASVLALMVQEHPHLFDLAVGQHGMFSRGNTAAQAGVGPNNTHGWAMGPPSAAELHGGLERLKAKGLSPNARIPRFYGLVGGMDRRVLEQFHTRPFARELDRLGVETLVVMEQNAGHRYAGTVSGASRQGGTNLAVYTQHLAGVRRPPGPTTARTAAEVALRHEPAKPLPPIPDIQLAAVGFRQANTSQLTGRTPMVAVEQWSSGPTSDVIRTPGRDRQLGRTFEK